MSIVIDESSHGETGAAVSVLQRQAGEMVEPWRIISLEIDDFQRLTPAELRRLGRWLTSQGRRIGREYTSSGAKRKLADEAGATLS